LFLDEVGDIPMPMQVKLLRLLESGLYRRVGSNEQRRADVRIVSATHRDLVGMVAEGKFREDLYHRLSTFPIRLPALRERTDDLLLLVEALFKRVAPRRRLRLSEDALRLMKQQPFPGNVRELRNLLERTALLCDGSVVEVDVLQLALDMGRVIQKDAAPLGVGASHPLKDLQAAFLRERLEHHQGSRAELARELGISERTLYRKLKAAQLLSG
jgi:DNA-binding NtrC family response regulator